MNYVMLEKYFTSWVCKTRQSKFISSMKTIAYG